MLHSFKEVLSKSVHQMICCCDKAWSNLFWQCSLAMAPTLSTHQSRQCYLDLKTVRCWLQQCVNILQTLSTSNVFRCLVSQCTGGLWLLFANGSWGFPLFLSLVRGTLKSFSNLAALTYLSPFYICFTIVGRQTNSYQLAFGHCRSELVLLLQQSSQCFLMQYCTFWQRFCLSLAISWSNGETLQPTPGHLSSSNMEITFYFEVISIFILCTKVHKINFYRTALQLSTLPW